MLTDTARYRDVYFDARLSEHYPTLECASRCVPHLRAVPSMPGQAAGGGRGARWLSGITPRPRMRASSLPSAMHRARHRCPALRTGDYPPEGPSATVPPPPATTAIGLGVGGLANCVRPERSAREARFAM